MVSLDEHHASLDNQLDHVVSAWTSVSWDKPTGHTLLQKYTTESEHFEWPVTQRVV